MSGFDSLTSDRLQAKDYLNPGVPFVKFAFGSRLDNAVNLTPRFLVSMTERKYSDTISVVDFQLFDQSWDTLEELLVSMRADSNLANKQQSGSKTGTKDYQSNENLAGLDVVYQYGWTGDGSPKSSTMQGQIIAITPSFTFQGCNLNITVSVGKFDELQNKVHCRAFSGGAPVTFTNNFDIKPSAISDIVRFIAKECGLKADVEDTETIDDFGVGFQQVHKTNANFITEDLIPIARSKSGGYTDYTLTIRGDTLVFKPKVLTKIYSSYSFARDQQGTMSDFQATINGALALYGFLGNQLAVAWDNIEKKIIKDTTNYDTYTRKGLSKQIPDLRTETPDELHSRRYVVPFTNPALVKAWNQATFETKLKGVVQAKAVIVADPWVNPLDIIEVIIRKDDASLHYLSGNYLITSVTTSLSGGYFYTALEMMSDGTRAFQLPDPKYTDFDTSSNADIVARKGGRTKTSG